ncbi:hypothetical protein BU14_0220s0001 [Porphyra umbilicalis]|uniref:Uncharacterized protein n=1 Tax=Porphyra umbilicalis TaxID=2786 RepID=A0A1X6P4U4_PORUM|nr:hypothetical protein BU14_0220s0001 [Porphyra umbilicalis]|eukprot:OSX75770.1 hypothetical protein BU14_0220s0001 [Porphyra umbilicalis]
MSTGRRLRRRRRRRGGRPKTTATPCRRPFKSCGRRSTLSPTCLCARPARRTARSLRSLWSGCGPPATFTRAPTRASTARGARSTRTPRTSPAEPSARRTKRRARSGPRRITFSACRPFRPASRPFTTRTPTLWRPPSAATRCLGGSRRASATLASAARTTRGASPCRGTPPKPCTCGLTPSSATCRASSPTGRRRTSTRRSRAAGPQPST